MITPEKIKEIGKRSLGSHELVVGEIQAIYDAANKKPFELICYAYAYGFHRGEKARKGHRQKWSNSPVVVERVTAYEQEYGRKPTDAAIRMAEHVDKVGAMLREQGRKDAREGREQLCAEVFPTLVRWIFRMEPDEDSELVEVIADLWRMEYEKGYSARKEEK